VVRNVPRRRGRWKGGARSVVIARFGQRLPIQFLLWKRPGPLLSDVEFLGDLCKVVIFSWTIHLDILYTPSYTTVVWRVRTAKRVSEMNANDDRRDKILRFLYDRHRAAKGITAIPIGILDLRREMKSRYGMKQQDVASNLDYLIQVGWVRPEVMSRSFVTPGGMVLPREQTKYKISEIGINHLEAASMFKRPQAASQVNITNVQGVTVVGDGNVVNAKFTDLSTALDELDQAIANSRQLSDEQKLDAAGDISTIRAQVAKKNPDPSLIRGAWEGLKAFPVLGNAADAITKVGNLVADLLP
jgi:hypothetical protein